MGTPVIHKGLELLRIAVRELVAEGYEFALVVTAERPADAQPWETWTGLTSLEEGRRIVGRSDVVGVVSERRGYGRAQFPVKLIDGMLAGRAILTTDLPIHRWALGDTGVFVPPGHAKPIRQELLRLREPALRSRLGDAARKRAIERFTPEAAADGFERTVRFALGRSA